MADNARLTIPPFHYHQSMANQWHGPDGKFTKRPDGAPISKAKTRADWTATDELGVQTKQRYGSSIFDDFLPQLRGTNALRVLREMSDNDATVGSILFSIEQVLRQAPWAAESASDSPQDEAAALFLDECVGDMEGTWADHISAGLTMLPFGFSWFEQVFRLRRPEEGSRFNDGKLGWRKMGFRPQDTLSRWEEDDDGEPCFVQDTGSELVVLPHAKAVHYKTNIGRGTPEGRSILRNAYRSWYFKKRAEEVLLIGMERSLAGLPIARIPAESIIHKDLLYERAKLMVQRVRQDEQMGVVWPSDKWPGTSENMYEFDTLKSEGPRSLDPVQVVRMFANDIAASVLAGFIYLGRDAVGSRALATPMQEIFQRALESWLDSMEDTFHQQATLKLLRLNGFQIVSPPRWRHGTVQDVDLAELGAFVQAVSATGYDWGVLSEGDPIRDQFRTLAGFDPEPASLVKGRRWDGGKALWLPPR
uniref:Putative structural protein n=1 Tax=viral metagenome TaxID=1070528 RepID=A0A6M3LLP4_9ZZZZ